MKNLVLATIAFSTLLTSCGQKINAGKSAGKYVNTIVLGKYNDIVTPRTFDEASLNDVPRSVNLVEDMTTVKNQSDRGACTFFSTTALIEATIKKDQKADINISEEYMNYLAKTQGWFAREEGSTVLENITTTNKKGMLLERESSYQASWFAKGLPCENYKAEDKAAPSECFSHKAPDAQTLKKVITTEFIQFTGAEKDTNEIIRFLATEKRPLTVSIAVNFDGWPTTGDIVHNEELRRSCLDETAICGGHSVLVTGYDLDKKVFFFKNSWGTDWGNEGYGTMTIETFDRYAGRDLYFAKLTNKVKLPADANIDTLSVSDFSFNQENEEGKLTIKVKGKVEAARGRMIYLSSFLTKRTDLALGADDKNSELKALTLAEQTVTGETYIRAVHYNVTPQDTLNWDETTPLSLNFLKGTEVSVANALKSSDETMIRTSIYVHTDTESWKVLKRIYLPLEK